MNLHVQGPRLTLWVAPPPSEQACTQNVCLLSDFGHVPLLAIPWTVAHRAPLYMEFSRQEYWSVLSFPPPGDLLDPGIEFVSLTSPALAGRFFTTSVTWMVLHELLLDHKEGEVGNLGRLCQDSVG